MWLLRVVRRGLGGGRAEKTCRVKEWDDKDGLARWGSLNWMVRVQSPTTRAVQKMQALFGMTCSAAVSRIAKGVTGLTTFQVVCRFHFTDDHRAEVFRGATDENRHGGVLDGLLIGNQETTALSGVPNLTTSQMNTKKQNKCHARLHVTQPIRGNTHIGVSEDGVSLLDGF